MPPMPALREHVTIKPFSLFEADSGNQIIDSPVTEPNSPIIERQRMDVDIVCVGFGPATAGFLTTLSKQLVNADGTPAVESATTPGMPPQVLCYERADDIGFGVSGVVTKARALRATFPDLDQAQIPMAAPVGEEKVLYLLDPDRRQPALGHVARGGCDDSRVQMGAAGGTRRAQSAVDAFLPAQAWRPDPLDGPVHAMGRRAGAKHRHGPNLARHTRVAGADRETNKVVGVRLLDQGVDKKGKPADGFTPGMDIHAALTVVADGPVGPIGQQLDAHFGMPEGHHTRDWAVGMKFVVDLPEDTPLKPGTVLHTFGFPEPEIFGFFYVHPDRVASLGIFVPSWFDSPMRTAYRQLQHWMLHPYLWRYLKGGKLRSWGAKTLGESGRRGEPHLVGDGYARVGEGSGSTNVLTGSGVDEAWATGTQLAEAVLELLKAKKPFTKQNLDETYVKRRRASWVEKEAIVAEKSRDGFQKGVVRGMIGMALAGLTNGKLTLAGDPVPPWKRIPSIEEYYRGRVSPEEIAKLHAECQARNSSLHGALMEKAGWPAIPYDGQLLMSHQDALLMGGKVQAPPVTPTTSSFSTRNCARNAARRFASRLAPARPSRSARAACRISTARNASTAARACGTARNRCRTIPNAPTSPSAPAPAACIRRRIELFDI